MLVGLVEVDDREGHARVARDVATLERVRVGGDEDAVAIAPHPHGLDLRRPMPGQLFVQVECSLSVRVDETRELSLVGAELNPSSFGIDEPLHLSRDDAPEQCAARIAGETHAVPGATVARQELM